MTTMKKRIAALAAAALAGALLWAGALFSTTDTSRYEISIKEQRLGVEHQQDALRDLIIPT